MNFTSSKGNQYNYTYPQFLLIPFVVLDLCRGQFNVYMYKRRIPLNLRLGRFTVLFIFHFVFLQETCTPSVELVKFKMPNTQTGTPLTPPPYKVTLIYLFGRL